MSRPLTPVAAVVSFIDRINHGDLEGLVALMTDDHALRVLDEPAIVGRHANRSAWRGYMTSFPQYVICPARFVVAAERVAILGATTGSHLGLPDEEEKRHAVIWVATVEGGKLSSWTIVEDSLERRASLGLT